MHFIGIRYVLLCLNRINWRFWTDLWPHRHISIQWCFMSLNSSKHAFSHTSMQSHSVSRQYQYSEEIPPRFPHAYTSRQAPTDLLCCKAFLMRVLNESKRIDGPRIITFSREQLSFSKWSRTVFLKSCFNQNYCEDKTSGASNEMFRMISSALNPSK